MLAIVGPIFAIVLLVVMIIKGIDMIAAAVITTAIILLNSQLSLSDGLFTTLFGDTGDFVAFWFLILGMGGIFGQPMLEIGLTTKIAKWLTQKLGAKMVSPVILIYILFITLLGINGYIMVFVLYPIAGNLLRENRMDRRLLPFMLLGGEASANGLMYTLDIYNVPSSGYLGTSLGLAPFLSPVFIVIVAVRYFVYFNYAQAQSRRKRTNEELLTMYADSNKIMSDEELPGIGMSVLPFVAVFGIVVATSSWGTPTSILFFSTMGILLTIATQFKRIENTKSSAETGVGSGLNSMLTVATVMGLSEALSLLPVSRELRQVILAMNMPVYLKTYFRTAVLAGLTGSVIPDETIFLESFDQTFMDTGVNVQALHRIVAKSALILNKLSNPFAAIPTMLIRGCSLKEGRRHVILGTVIPAVAAGLVIVLMTTFGITF